MEYSYKGGLMEEDMFKFKVGGRTSGQTFTNAMTLLKYINELQPNKMYGIMKAGTSITLLTKKEVIPKSLIKEKIEELDNVNNAEALEDLMNTKNYTITQLVQYVLQDLLREE